MQSVGWLLLQTMNADAAGFDLAKLPARRECGSASSVDIVVCGRPESHRLEELPAENYAEQPLRAEARMGRAKAGVAVETYNLPGAVSQRVMVKLKLPF